MTYKTGKNFLLVTALALSSAMHPVFSDLDEDFDGLSDVWERQFGAQLLSATADTDQDGHDNSEESIAGTDPLSATSCFTIINPKWLPSGQLMVNWPSVRGKVYHVVLGTNPDPSTWVNEGTTFYGNGNTLTALFSAHELPKALGGLSREVWYNIPGTKISDLTRSTAYGEVPDGIHLIASSATTDDGSDDFGARLRGWIVPKENRQVVFYVAANTSAEFYFSTTESPDDATRICRVLDATQPNQWHKSFFQQSLPYGVEAGKRYYIEVLHKHDKGNDHVSIGWRDFDEVDIEVIDAEQLAPWLDTSESQSRDFLANNDLSYIAMAVSDSDTDADNVSTWEETQMGNLNPFLSTSSGGTLDLTTIQSRFKASSDVINATTTAALAVEKEGTLGTIRLDRTGSVDPITLYFNLTGDSDPTKGSASTGDYELRDVNDNVLTNSIDLPFAASSVDVYVHAIKDSITEVPETLTLTLVADAAYTLGGTTVAEVSIRDAENTTDNQRLFVGYLSSENGAETSGSGIVSVLLQGDNDTAKVNMTFSGLTTEQSAAHIHVANPVSGPIVQGLPLGQIADFEWPVRAATFMTTDQAVLNALFSGALYANVHSAQYPGGEIRGDLNYTTGKTSLQTPPPEPAIPVLTNEDLDRDINRFLQQATFGPTTASVAEVKAMIQDPGIGNGNQIAGYAAWIDQQMNSSLTPTMNLREYTKAVMANMTNSNSHEARRYGMWLNAVYGKDQLRQRMAFALSQIFVTSDQDTTLRNAHLGMANFYQMLTDNAFGYYEDMLMAVSRSPIMGHYLSHLRNQKAVLDNEGNVLVSPDENYAREIMQLFSVGLVELNLDHSIRLGQDGLPIPTYDNTTITEMARVFTGLSFGMYENGGVPVNNTAFFRGNSTGTATQTRWTEPMKMFDAYHDTGEKVILENVVLPPGLSGDTDLQIVCSLMGTHDNTAPFMALRLIQRFVTSNPSQGYVYRVAKKFDDEGGDLGETLKVILLDYEARSLDSTEHVTFGKPKEPVVKMIQLMRVLNPASGMPLADLAANGYPAEEIAKFPAGVTRLRYRDHDDLGQIMHSSPSVFNFFQADFRKPGKLSLAGLATPELQIKTESQVYDYMNEVYDVTINTRVTGDGVPDGESDNSLDNIDFDLSPFQAVYDDALAEPGGTETTASTALVDAIDALMNASELRATYLNAATPNPRSLLIETVVNTTESAKVQNALYTMVNSPQFSTQK